MFWRWGLLRLYSIFSFLFIFLLFSSNLLTNVHCVPRLPSDLKNVKATTINITSGNSTTNFSVSLPVSSQASAYLSNTLSVLDNAGALFYENALWTHPAWTYNDYMTLVANVTQYFQEGNTLRSIISVLSVTGSLPLAIFLVVNLIFFIVSILQFLFLPFCCCCCSTTRKHGFRRRSIVSTSVFTLIFLGGFIFLSVMSIFYSGNISVSIVAMRNATLNIFGSGAKFTENLNTAAKTVNNSVAHLIPDIVAAIETLDYNATVIFPTLDTPFQGFVADWNQLSTLNDASQVSINTSATTIAQYQSARASNVQALDALSQALNALHFVTIDGVNYSTPNPPTGGSVSSSQLPDLGSLPSLTSIRNNINSIPNLTSTSTTFQVTYAALPAALRSNVSAQLNAANFNSSDFGASYRPVLQSISSTAQAMSNSIYGFGNTTKSIIDSSILQADYIRSDVTKILYFIFIGFCSIGCIGVFIQKGKCMCLVFPFIFLLAIVFWLQFFLYFVADLPINEICRERVPLLGSTFTFQGLTFSPNAALTSCSNHADLFNLTVQASSNITFVEQIGLAGQLNISSSTQAVVSSIAGGSLNSTIQAGVSNPFPDFVTMLNGISAAIALPNGFQFSVFQVASPYSLSALNSNLSAFSAGLTPSSINPSFSDTTMTNKISNFNSLALSQNASWVSWTYNDIEQHFITNGETFSAATYVTGSSSNSNNGQIDNAFATAFADVRYKHAALITIASMQGNVTTLSNDAAAVLTPIQTNLNTISTNTTALNTSLERMNRLIFTLNTTDDPDLTAAMNQLPINLFNEILNVIQEHVRSYFNSVIQTFGSGTDCYDIAVSVLDTVEVFCTTTRNSLNGMWMSTWLAGINVFPTLIAMLFAYKRLGHLLVVTPVEELENSHSSKSSAKKPSKKAKKVKGKSKSGRASDHDDDEKRPLKSAAMLED